MVSKKSIYWNLRGPNAYFQFYIYSKFIYRFILLVFLLNLFYMYSIFNWHPLANREKRYRNMRLQISNNASLSFAKFRPNCAMRKTLLSELSLFWNSEFAEFPHNTALLLTISFLPILFAYLAKATIGILKNVKNAKRDPFKRVNYFLTIVIIFFVNIY